MTGPSINRLTICPLRFRIASPGVPIDLGFASVNRNSWGGDPESLGANRSAYYPRDQSLFVYYKMEIVSTGMLMNDKVEKYDCYHCVWLMHGYSKFVTVCMLL